MTNNYRVEKSWKKRLNFLIVSNIGNIKSFAKLFCTIAYLVLYSINIQIQTYFGK